MAARNTWTGCILILLIVFFASCDSEDFCLSNQHAVQTGFYNTYTSITTDKDTSLTDVSIYGVGMTDSVYESITLNEAFLPLSFDNDPDTTPFVIKAKNKIDTIKFVHTKELDFISGDCGYVFKFQLDTVIFAGYLIDSVAISYPKVKYGEDIENVKIYFY